MIQAQSRPNLTSTQADQAEAVELAAEFPTWARKSDLTIESSVLSGLGPERCWRYVEEILATKHLVASGQSRACKHAHADSMLWAERTVAAVRASPAANLTCPQHPLWDRRSQLSLAGPFSARGGE